MRRPCCPAGISLDLLEFPRWTHAQVKSTCGGDLAKALIRMLGGDSKPNPRDLSKSFQSNENFFEDVEDEEFYE